MSDNGKIINDDKILREMAAELRAALIGYGLDPKAPPENLNPPSAASFAEYQRRGGMLYTDPDAFIAALVKATSR